jgi:tetratricopeptide (TPR) repeat protein
VVRTALQYEPRNGETTVRAVQRGSPSRSKHPRVNETATDDPARADAKPAAHGPPHPFAAALSLFAAAAALLLAMYRTSLLPGSRAAATAAGCTLGLATLAGLVVLVRRRNSPRDDSRREPSGATLLALPAIALLTAAAAASAAAMIPFDLSLVSLARPPQSMPWLIAALAVLGTLATANAASDGSPAVALVPLLVTTLTLEGRVLLTPSWFGLLLAATILALTAAPRATPTPSIARPALLAASALTVVIALAAAFSIDPGRSLDPALRIVALLLGAWALARTGAAGARAAIATLLVVAALAALVGLASKALLIRALPGLGIDGFAAELALFERHPNLVAPWFGAATVLAGFTLLATRGAIRTNRVLVGAAWIALPLALLATLLTASRLALAATALVALTPLLLRSRHPTAGPARSRAQRAKVAVSALFALSAVLAVTAAFVPPLKVKLLSVARLEDGAIHRLYRMRVGLDTALERPWLGQGPGCYFRQGAFVPTAAYAATTTADHPHSHPLALLLTCGALGLLAYLASLALAAQLVRRVRGDAGASAPVAAKLAAAVALAATVALLASLFDLGDALDTPIPSRLLLDVGIVAALAAATRSARDAGPVRATWLLPVTAAAMLVALAIGIADSSALRGGELLRRGSATRAADEYARACAILPFSADLTLESASAALQSGRTAQANELSARAIELAPLRPDLHEARAMLRRQVDDRDGALAAARRALELDPHGATASRLAPLLAELEIASGKRDAGLERLANAFLANPYFLISRAVPREDGRKDLVAVGALEIDVDDILAAVPDLTEAPVDLARVPSLRELDFALAVVDAPRARSAFTRYVALEPIEVTRQRYESRVLHIEGDLEAALALARQAAPIGNLPTAYADVGELLLELGEPAAAREAFRAAYPVARDVLYAAGDYAAALTRFAAASGDDPGEASIALEHAAFFRAAPLDRAADLEAAAAAATRAGAGERALALLRRSLDLTLISQADDRSRDLSRRLGSALAAARPDDVRASAFADDLERRAAELDSNLLAAEFRVALLRSLGLEQRALAATHELRSLIRR